MIILLPLRGLAGDAMATQMSIQAASAALIHHVVATESIADDAYKSRATGHFHDGNDVAFVTASADCLGHASPDSSKHVSDSHCETCAACQTCHTPALETATMASDVMIHTPGTPSHAAPSYASADRALGLKPPIS